MTDLSVDVHGEGETVVLVHGSGFRDTTWSDQLALADRYRLVLPFRRGYGPSPPADSDFDVDARDLVALLDEPAHLVGHSYGGVAALVAAGFAPELVRSLIVIEPPALGVARGNPEVEGLIERVGAVRARGDELATEEFGREFTRALGFERPLGRVRPEILSAVESLRRERDPWEAEVDLERVRTVPTLVVSGAWSPALDAVCDVLVERLGAERAVFPGSGHGAQHAPGFNERLIAFLEHSE